MAIAEDLAVIHDSTVEDPFTVEQHGIDYIPISERWATPKDIFGMWAGASVQVEYFVYGAILMTFGFTFAQALSLIIIGNLSFLLLGLCSLQGPDAGTSVFAINRAAFGPNGSRPDLVLQLDHPDRLRGRGAHPHRRRAPGPHDQGRFRPR